ncbi:DivIVA domain-containing protein [Nocardia sp. BMG111209]|uniref:DivIVA domain-containing protein n=1 Tax=Nocardia sp. BMG111209 TaxID=1160137 RepID=UPI00039AC8A4|nr:DivIVA domain-containing protein [Nocardia sp. BMG111209]
MTGHNDNPKFGGGPGSYNADEVDAYLDLVEQELSGLIDEKTTCGPPSASVTSSSPSCANDSATTTPSNPHHAS